MPDASSTPSAIIAAAPSQTLFARLEHEHDVAVELVAVRAKQAGRADEHRGVQVVTTGVHGAMMRGLKMSTGIFEIRFDDGQRVHVAAQEDYRAGSCAPQDRRDRGQALAGADLQRQCGDRGEHALLSPRQVEPDLRNSVQVTTQSGEVGLERCGVRPQLGIQSQLGIQWQLGIQSQAHGVNLSRCTDKIRPEIR